ncbi:hydrolase 1, exosortase A system-associated [Altererythrobacter confluentis]|uniref:Hydrolase 1, exosortase A system-associated n=1 Tax=Allopontixanthobacter confluentis TaxID=1849021 RepID=A0A6L7GFJ3_9SPHN|nr:hydrolase 1, exosortase A system-associated [Allopontixanthobacter confluentis]MXP14265.1 hydrolase 1, exosortase A system-associated [Allopontixanthobacter confluentis]
MKRLHLTFSCSNSALAGTLDTAPSTTGLLIVSGGNDTRAGAFGGQAEMAARIARAGFPVFRFDRRGIGDSCGENRGFRRSGNDVAAALSAFGAMAPQVTRIVGFGNCDAASALMLTSGAGFDRLILSNPWVEEASGPEDQTIMAPQAIRSRYLEKLKNPEELKRLFKGDVNFTKLVRGLGTAAKIKSKATSLSAEMTAGLGQFAGPVKILLAMKDRTALNFKSVWDPADARISRCAGADHSYSHPDAREWLYQQLLLGLRA